MTSVKVLNLKCLSCSDVSPIIVPYYRLTHSRWSKPGEPSVIVTAGDSIINGLVSPILLWRKRIIMAIEQHSLKIQHQMIAYLAADTLRV